MQKSTRAAATSRFSTGKTQEKGRSLFSRPVRQMKNAESPEKKNMTS